jgi:peptidoglycan/LPS O-acetylase OafA/YrhL
MHWFHVAAALFYVANMDVTRPWIFGHLWSLGIEEQFYLLWPLTLKKWYRYRTVILLCVMLAIPMLRAACFAFKVQGGFLDSLPMFADHLAIGCLLAIFAPRMPRIKKPFAVLMLAVMIFSPWFPGTSALRTLFALFIVQPVVHLSIAGSVLHVIQHPYWVLNWKPVA